MKERRSRPRRRSRKQIISGAAAVGAAITITHSAEAATFNVTNLNDGALPLAGSLRQAIEDANTTAGPDIITFQSGLTGTITLSQGQLAIKDSVDIQGPGPSAITIDADDASRVFYLYQTAAQIDVTISGLTITGGDEVNGGGIFALGENLTLNNSVLTGNHADGAGGGLFASFGDVTITGSVISGNDATNGLSGTGGGAAIYGSIYTATEVSIQDTTITGNSADTFGGGMFVLGSVNAVTLDHVILTDNTVTDGGSAGAFFGYLNGTLTIESSTISGNQVNGSIGGIGVSYVYGETRISNSTISGNQALAGETDDAGGLFLGPGTNAVIENSTISGNSAVGDGGGVYVYFAYSVSIRHTTISGNTAGGAGGGIYAFPTSVNLENSIVANSNDAADDVCGTGAYNVSFSLIEDVGTATINDLTPGDNLFGVDPDLGALQSNGGPTQTHKPNPTSPVIGAGDPAFTPPPATDQRGLPREVPDGGLDMGSVELQPGVLQFLVATDSVAEDVPSGTITITVTRTGGSDGAVSVPVSVAGGTATGGGVDYTFAAPALNWAHGDAANKTFTVAITNDALFEPNETFILQLGAPTGGATLGTNVTETVTIVENEPQPSITINDVALPEGNAGTTNFPFTVMLSGPSASPVTVNFTTNPVSATEGTDYADATGMVTFPAMSTSQPINVTVNGDLLFEPDETFHVVLSGASGAAIGDDTGIGTIQNDEAGVADLAILKTITGSGPFSVGQNVTFNIAVTNNGPSIATGVTVTDAIASNATFVSATPSQGTCSGTTTVTCTLGSLGDDASATITLVVQITAGGPGMNTATVSGTLSDGTPANNASTVLFQIAAGSAPTLSQTMQLVMAGLLALLALGVLGRKN